MRGLCFNLDTHIDLSRSKEVHKFFSRGFQAATFYLQRLNNYNEFSGTNEKRIQIKKINQFMY